MVIGWYAATFSVVTMPPKQGSMSDPFDSDEQTKRPTTLIWYFVKNKLLYTNKL